MRMISLGAFFSAWKDPKVCAELIRSLRLKDRLFLARLLINVLPHRIAGSTKVLLESAQLFRQRQEFGLAKATLMRALPRLKGKVRQSVKRSLRQLSALERVNVKVLASAQDHRITLYSQRAGSGVVVVTFGTISSSLNTEPFGFPFLIEQGYDHIHVAQSKYTLYQSLSLEEFQKIVAVHCKGKKVVSYGSSLGGYAALYFGGCLDAKIIAASPVNFVDKVILVKRWALVPMRHSLISENPTSSKAPVIFYDPLDDERDRVYLAKRVLPAYPNAKVIPIPGGGHATFNELQKRGILKSTILSIVEGNFDARKLLLELNEQDEQKAQVA
ncbi:hypothetical protein [Sinorhizobium sp. BG8]|uniref:hypothetical protein n=1 Tax=Sinorhizobium sp. BG8 TaxID=2613773 RepID=UPI00193E7321|nr:hypothetical protein [Sinorhizobium sp. BG8]QRM54084.1 hypothetical protein F3Y30_05610 [Sinorhizobium sp. BG8]